MGATACACDTTGFPVPLDLKLIKLSAKFSLATALLCCLGFKLNLTLALSLAASLKRFALSTSFLILSSCVAYVPILASSISSNKVFSCAGADCFLDSLYLSASVFLTLGSFLVF